MPIHPQKKAATAGKYFIKSNLVHILCNARVLRTQHSPNVTFQWRFSYISRIKLLPRFPSNRFQCFVMLDECENICFWLSTAEWNEEKNIFLTWLHKLKLFATISVNNVSFLLKFLFLPKWLQNHKNISWNQSERGKTRKENFHVLIV